MEPLGLLSVDSGLFDRTASSSSGLSALFHTPPSPVFLDLKPTSAGASQTPLSNHLIPSGLPVSYLTRIDLSLTWAFPGAHNQRKGGSVDTGEAEESPGGTQDIVAVTANDDDEEMLDDDEADDINEKNEMTQKSENDMPGVYHAENRMQTTHPSDPWPPKVVYRTGRRDNWTWDWESLFAHT